MIAPISTPDRGDSTPTTADHSTMSARSSAGRAAAVRARARRAVAIFGAGAGGRLAANHLAHEARIVAFVDTRRDRRRQHPRRGHHRPTDRARHRAASDPDRRRGPPRGVAGMRVLVVSNLFPPAAIDGYEIGASWLCRELARRGHTVTVCSASRYLWAHTTHVDDVPCVAPGDLPWIDAGTAMFGFDLPRLLDGGYAPVFDDARLGAHEALIGSPPKRVALRDAARAAAPDAVLLFNPAGLLLPVLHEVQDALPDPVRTVAYVSDDWPLRWPAAQSVGRIAVATLRGRAAVARAIDRVAARVGTSGGNPCADPGRRPLSAASSCAARSARRRAAACRRESSTGAAGGVVPPGRAGHRLGQRCGPRSGVLRHGNLVGSMLVRDQQQQLVLPRRLRQRMDQAPRVTRNPGALEVGARVDGDPHDAQAGRCA